MSVASVVINIGFGLGLALGTLALLVLRIPVRNEKPPVITAGGLFFPDAVVDLSPAAAAPHRPRRWSSLRVGSR